MTHQDTTTGHSTLQKHMLAAEPIGSIHQLGFFQAIRRIEELSKDLPRVGHAVQASQEALRITQPAELDFAAATIDRIDSRQDGRIELSQRFFGLLGPSGPLPLPVTEQARHESRHENDSTMESFINLFHHRLATLFYRAWSSSRGAIQRDRPDEDRYAAFLGALSGVMRQHRADAEREPNESRLYFTGRFGSAHRNAEGLGALIAATFRAKVQVESFILRHLRLESEDRTLLSPSASVMGRGGRLGQGVVLGRSVPDRNSTIGVRIGPIPFEQFQNLLPGGAFYQKLCNMIRGYVDPAIDCRIRLILDRDTIPQMTLGREGALGRSAWMHSRTPKNDASDCQFQV